MKGGIRVVIGSVDAGKNGIKGVFPAPIGNKYIYFTSSLCHYRELKVDVPLDHKNMVIEYQSKKYFGGELALRDGYIPLSYKAESKLHETTLINVLAALHQVNDTRFKIIVGSPISVRTEHEKEALKSLIKGEHTIKVNGVEKKINIERVEVSPEGAAGFYSQPEKGEVQGFDFGSTTINYFYFSNGSFVDKFSGNIALEDGLMDPKEVMESLNMILSNKFNPHHRTMIMGGKAQTMFPYVKKYYPNSFIVQNPLFANAIGFYQIARKVYG
jgi:plasmid segregation protein ParM